MVLMFSLLSFQRYMLSDSDEHRQLFDLIEKMLEYDPQHRMTAEESLKHTFFDKLPADKKDLEIAKSEERARSHSLSR